MLPVFVAANFSLASGLCDDYQVLKDRTLSFSDPQIAPLT